MKMTKDEKQALIGKFQVAKADTGSAKVQVALVTARISQLNQHFEGHKKDHSSRRGLLKMVGHRRKLLSYLKKNDKEGYQKLVDDLGLRK